MPSRRVIRISLAIAVILVLAVFVGGTVGLLSRPVLFTTPFIVDSHCDGDGVTLFNPFRNQEPEIAADEFLNLLKQGQCDRAVENIPPSDLRTLRCVKEREYPLSSWRLTDRKDEDDQKVTLSYCYKNQKIPIEEHLGLLLEKKGSWRVVDYSRVY